MRWIRDRWSGRTPLRRLLWRDMVVFGTALNAVATFVALMLAAQDVTGGWVAAAHFAPMPVNLLLALAAHRHADATVNTSVLAFAWLAAMTLL